MESGYSQLSEALALSGGTFSAPPMAATMQSSSSLPRIQGADLAERIRRRKEAEACVEQMANRLQHLRNQQTRTLKQMQDARAKTREVLNTRSRNEEAVVARKRLMERPLKRPADPEMTNPDSWIPAAKTAGWVDHVVKPEETKSKKEYVAAKMGQLAEKHKENQDKRRHVRRDHSRARHRAAEAAKKRDKLNAAIHDKRVDDEDARELNAMAMLQIAKRPLWWTPFWFLPGGQLVVGGAALHSLSTRFGRSPLLSLLFVEILAIVLVRISTAIVF